MSNVFFIGRTDLVEHIPFGIMYQISLDQIIQKIFGGFRSFFLQNIKDELWCFGDNSHGQLGLGEVYNIQKRPIKLQQKYTALYCSESYTYSTDKNTLYYWGENNLSCSPEKGQQLKPISIPQKNVTQMSLQNERCYYLEDGKLYGQGFTQILGFEFKSVSIIKPVLIKNRVIKITSSEYHTLLLDENKEVYSWGFGNNAELGLQMEGYTFSTYKQIPTKIPNLKDIQDIACSQHYSLALNIKGIIYEWGNGFNKELSFEEALQIKEIELPNSFANIRKIQGSNNTIGCVDQLGRLYYWNQENNKVKQLKMKIRCEEFICGDNIILFVGNKSAYHLSDNFKLQIKSEIRKFKDYVDLKNSKVTNLFYDEQKQIKNLRELNERALSVQQQPFEMEDVMVSRFRKHSSLYQVKRKNTYNESNQFNSQNQNNLDKTKTLSKLSKLKSTPTSIQTSRQRIICSQYRTNSIQDQWQNFQSLSKKNSKSKSQLSLRLLNPKLESAIEIDKVSDLILESERINPLYIPLQNKDEIIKIKTQQNNETKFHFIEDKHIMKYEYVKRIYNGYHEKLLMDNLMTKEQSFVPIKWKRLRDDTKLYQDKYTKMKQRLLKKQLEAKMIIKIQDY